jgi:hypothetical protein
MAVGCVFSFGAVVARSEAVSGVQLVHPVKTLFPWLTILTDEQDDLQKPGSFG